MPFDVLVDVVAHYLLNVVTSTTYQIAVLMGPLVVLAAIMNGVAAGIERAALQTLGFRVYYSIFGWLGTIVHESGHLLFCLMFGHRVDSVKLFDFHPVDGTLGHVFHRYRSGNLYHAIGNFFIGAGPILLGSIVIYYAGRYLIGGHVFDTVSLNLSPETLMLRHGWPELGWQIVAAVKAIVVELSTTDNLKSWQLYVFLYLVFAVGSSIRLSAADLKGTTAGFGAIVLLILVFNLVTRWTGAFADWAVARVASAYGFFGVVLAFSTLTNGIVAALLLCLPGSQMVTKSAVRAMRRRPARTGRSRSPWKV